MGFLIQYGTFIIGSSNSTIREGSYRETHSYRKYSLSVDFLVFGSDDATFQSNIQAAETELEKDNQRLLIQVGASTLRDLDPASYTGLNIRTSLQKSGSDLDTARSRAYTFQLTADLPADSVDDSFRREAQWSLSYDASRRIQLNFSGTYTAGKDAGVPKKAEENYSNKVQTWIDSVFTDLSPVFNITQADFELVDERIDSQDDDHHIIRFSRSYLQTLFPNKTWASGTPNNDLSIQNAQVSFSRSNTPVHGNKQKAPVRVSVSYSCNVDRTQSDYTQLDDLWKDTIKPWILSQAKERWGGSLSVIESEQADISPTANTIRASMTVLIYAGDNNKMREDVSITFNHNERITFLDLWDGKPHTYSIFSPSEVITANVTTTIESINTQYSSFSNPPHAPDGVSSGAWVLTQKSRTEESETRGIDADGKGQSVTVYKTTFRQDYRWVENGKMIQILVQKSDGRIVTGSGQTFLNSLKRNR